MTAAAQPAQRPRRAADRAHRLDAPGLVLGTTTVVMGLIAGIFFGYACSVMIALGRVGDRTFVAVMQQIDDAIRNPVFFTAFFGTLVLAAVAAVQQRRLGGRAAARWTLAALVLYFVALAVTLGGNEPLNTELTAAGDPDRIAHLAAVRDRFEDPWNAWNVVRTVIHTAALACATRALVLHGRRPA